MGTKSISQLPLRTSYDGSDRIPVAFYDGSQWHTRYVERSSMGIPVYSTSVEVPATEVVRLHDFPLECVPAQSGKTIVPIFAVIKRVSGTTDYDQYTGIVIGSTTGLNDTQFVLSGKLPTCAAEAAAFLLCVGVNGTSVPWCMVGDSLSLYVLNGNPDSGDGSYVLTTYYHLI